MVSSTRLLLIAVTLFSTLLNSTQAYCIYNNMENPIGTMDVYDPVHDNFSYSFKKIIPAGGKECCHYSNTDCNPSGRRDMLIYFHGWLSFKGLYREGHLKSFKCDAGGALNIYGTNEEDARAVCYYSAGHVVNQAIIGDV